MNFHASPDMVYQNKVALVPETMVQGPLTVEDAGGPAQAVNGTQNSHLVRIAFPDGVPPELTKVGRLAQVMMFTNEGNPITVLTLHGLPDMLGTGVCPVARNPLYRSGLRLC